MDLQSILKNRLDFLVLNKMLLKHSLYPIAFYRLYTQTKESLFIFKAAPQNICFAHATGEHKKFMQSQDKKYQSLIHNQPTQMQISFFMM